MTNIPIVAIIGRANVGKSSLFNRLVGSRQAVVDDAAGTTRDRVQAVARWGKHAFWLVDTAGLGPAGGRDELETGISEQIKQAAESADAIILVADAAVMITSEDRQAAKLALKTGKPVILALSKIDTVARGAADDFINLGIKDIIEVSALHGRGTGDLLDQVVRHLPPAEAPDQSDRLRLALLGRPNVGKSSLLNALAGKQQALVSGVPGTTRDVNAITVKYHGRELEISDTAGLRRRGKIDRGVEKFSTLRTLGAVASSDIGVLLIDAGEPSAAQDQHIAGLVANSGKGLILVVNKWDAVDKDDKTQARYLRRLQANFAFVPWAPVVFTSAATGLNVTRLFELATQIDQRRQTKIPTPALNKLIESLVLKQPPAGLKNRRPKINYAAQTGTNPPAFALFASHPEFIHFSYRRYLENGLRRAYDFAGTPVKLEYRDKRKTKA
ncbi:ribosome biogenesis GTPase Der [Candidatus Parcubacteria bacterium]|nr:ribosome biogenesis GTPase Der [Candidatus Parcubacteria bacterium]